jgi:hypothetical protein
MASLQRVTLQRVTSLQNVTHNSFSLTLWPPKITPAGEKIFAAERSTGDQLRPTRCSVFTNQNKSLLAYLTSFDFSQS